MVSGQPAQALLLAAHGSSRVPDAAEPVLRLVEALRSRHLFAEVEACFWKQEPSLSQGLARLKSDEVFVVPVLAAEGTFAREILPRELGLTGPLTTLADGRRVHYSRPVGSHPRMIELVQARADTVMALNRLDSVETALVLIGHGSRQGGGSRERVDELAARLAASGRYGEVVTLFVEEAPLVQDWPFVIERPNLIVMPVLVAEGQHGGRDIPPLFGVSELPMTGETVLMAQAKGHNIFYCRGLTDDSNAIEIILDLARQSGWTNPRENVPA
jgi:sirohydrochlorin cobaltochelatase